MFCHTTVAPFAVLTSQRHTDHARNAKVTLIKFPQAQQFIYDFFLLCQTTKLWNKSGLVNHGTEVEVATETVERAERDVTKRIQ